MKKLSAIAIRLFLTATLILGVTLSIAAAHDNKVKREIATSIYFNGTVVTVDKHMRYAEAVAVQNDTIIGVGHVWEMLRFLGKGTKLIDLKRKIMVPGFYDAHSHFSPTKDLYKVNLNSPPIGTMTSITDILDALSKTTPLNNWIQGTGYDDTLLAEVRHPNRYDLDKVSTTVPIYITHISGHLAACNTAALITAGINPDNPPVDPPGGHIQVQDGKVLGVFEEPSAMGLISKFIPGMTDFQRIAAIEYASQVYASKGVTTANQGASVELPMAGYYNISDLKNALDAGKLKVRVVTWPYITTYLESHLDYINAVVKPSFSTNKMITIGGAKIIADGSIQGYTGYLHDPYWVIPAGYPAGYRGYPAYTPTELQRLVKYAHDRGFQVFVHGNGDEAIEDILDAFEIAQGGVDNDYRNTVIHSQMAREDQLDRMEELGVLPSFYVLHTYYYGDRHRDIFMGPDRALRMSPTKSALNRGIPFTIHCDTPVVPIDPLLLMWAAVNRISTSGAPIYFKNIKDDPNKIDQRISPLEALRATTISAAYQNFEEDIKGSIEVGKLADFTILSDNPLKVPHMKIRDIKVIETIVGGNSVYKAE